jgi:hypothetical protein
VENLTPTRIRYPDRPAHSQSLYRLHYLAHNKSAYHTFIDNYDCSKFLTQQVQVMQIHGYTCIHGCFSFIQFSSYSHKYWIYRVFVLWYIGIHSFISIQPLGRFSRNQNPVRRTVWLWHTASWQVLRGRLPLLSPAFRHSHRLR